MRRKFTYVWDRTKPRTASERRARKLLGYQLKRMRKEIRQERKAKS